MDERGGLESRCGACVTMGSNPIPSAVFLALRPRGSSRRQRGPHPHRPDSNVVTEEPLHLRLFAHEAHRSASPTNAEPLSDEIIVGL